GGAPARAPRVPRGGPGPARRGAPARRRRASIALELLPEALELIQAEAAPRPARVEQLAVLVLAEVERAEAEPRPVGQGEAHDHEIACAVHPDLQPAVRA